MWNMVLMKYAVEYCTRRNTIGIMENGFEKGLVLRRVILFASLIVTNHD